MVCGLFEIEVKSWVVKVIVSLPPWTKGIRESIVATVHNAGEGRDKNIAIVV